MEGEREKEGGREGGRDKEREREEKRERGVVGGICGSNGTKVSTLTPTAEEFSKVKLGATD